METVTQQETDLNLRAVTIADMEIIISFYQQQNELFEILTETNNRFTNHFGLPLYVAEYKNKIIGYSYATITNSREYFLKSNFSNAFSGHPIKEILMYESELYLKNQWQKDSNKNLAIAITQLVNWLNNSNIEN